MKSRPRKTGLDSDAIRLSVATLTNPTLVVFFTPRVPPDEGLPARCIDGLDEFVGEPLLGAVRSFATQSLVFQDFSRDQLPPLPIPLLRHTGLDELAERKLAASTRAIMLGAAAPNRPPYLGLWSVLAGAHSLAQVVGGVAFDPAASRILSRRGAEPLTTDGRIAVASHVIVPFSIGDRGLGWMTTAGLIKFGLPELEIRHIPPNLDQLARLVNATAQCLVNLVSTIVFERGSAPLLELSREIQVTERNLAAAYDRPVEAASPSSGGTIVGLEYQGPSADQSSFLRLVKPRGFRGSHGEWLFQALKELLGTQRDLRNVQTSSDAMQDAHNRALAELPSVRARFARGLRPGETLYFKHGFEVGGAGREYMWVVVNTWEGSRIRGQLVNNARDRDDLKAGKDIELDEGEIFDWLITLPGGEEDGGYTTHVALRDGHPDAEGAR